MVVTKVWIGGEAKSLKDNEARNQFVSSISKRVLEMLLQSIFQNTSSEVVRGKDGKTNILGTPTETALIEFGMIFGDDVSGSWKESKIVKVEPFNSVKKKMSVLVALPGGGLRAFCKGASEIIFKMCDKTINEQGNSVPISEEQRKNITYVINSFACEALRTLCLTYNVRI